MEKSWKIQSKFFFFLIEMEFPIEVENNSQNIAKCRVFLHYVEDGDRLKSHSFSLPAPWFHWFVNGYEFGIFPQWCTPVHNMYKLLM